LFEFNSKDMPEMRERDGKGCWVGRWTTGTELMRNIHLLIMRRVRL